MTEDEQFASDLRPDSVFGALGSDDFFEDDDDGFDDFAEEPAMYSNAAPPSAAPRRAHAAHAAPLAQPQPTGSRTGAAVTFFTLLLGAGAGYYYGGFKGAAGGALAGGALRNLYRTQKAMRSGDAMQQAAAIQPGLIGLLGLAGGGYLLWTANKTGSNT